MIRLVYELHKKYYSVPVLYLSACRKLIGKLIAMVKVRNLRKSATPPGCLCDELTRWCREIFD